VSMKKGKNNNLGILVAVLLAGIIALIILLLTRIGSGYQKSISSVEQNKSSPPLNYRVAKNVRKVTVHDQKGNGCMEITPDGVVRKYSVCGEKLDSADRLRDPKNIIKLFRKISERDWATTTPPPSANVVKLTFENEDGTTDNYYVVIDDPDDTDITDVIDDITEDIPPQQSTPTPSPVPSSPPNSGTTNTPSPTQYIPPWVPTPTSPPIGDQPFLCGYTADGKPTNISNTMCSTLPTPMR